MNDLRKNIVEAYIHAYNQFDVEGMLKNLDKNIIFENISNGNVDLTTNGIDEFQKQAETAKTYFAQRQQTITNWDFQEEKITIDIDYQGILAIDLPNGMKVGDTLKLQGQSIFTFEEERIVRIEDRS